MDWRTATASSVIGVSTVFVGLYWGLYLMDFLTVQQVFIAIPVWMVAAVGLGALVYWHARHDVAAYRTRVFAWAVGGGLAFLALGGGIALSQELQGITAVDPAYMLVNLVVGGLTVGILVGIHDAHRAFQQDRITEESAENDRLVERLSVVLRILRHDIRTETNVILGHVNAIEDHDHETTMIEASARSIRDYGEDALLIEELLTRERICQSETDLVPMIREIVAGLEQRYPELAVTTTLPETAPAITVDVIDRALRELIANAAEHDPDPPTHVTVSVDRCEDTVVTTVTDDGPGLPQEELQVLNGNGETQLEHTSGLGLWIVAWSVEHSGGSIGFDSSDAGTTVRVSLPAA